MPSPTRWALTTRKWFTSISNTTHKRDNPILRSGTPVTRSVSLASNIAGLSKTKSRSKVTPINDTNSTNKFNLTSSTLINQLQLPAFSNRRERRTSTSFYRQNGFFPNHTEPTIRKNGRSEQILSIDVKRSSIQPIPITNFDPSKKENFQSTSSIRQMETSLFNMSRRCLVDYPRHSPIPIPMQQSPLPTRFSAESSLIDDDDNSSSSEIFNDEHRQYPELKDPVSTLDVLSVKSLSASQTSLNHFHSHPVIHYDRQPVYASEIVDDQLQQQQNSATPAPRPQSVQDNQTVPIIKRQQSSASIIKKIEKYIGTSQSPIIALEKPEFVRVANATYRLTVDKVNYISDSHKNAVDSFVGCTNSDDSLRPANDEECYATLPRGSSTEHTNKNIQNDLRIIVDGYIRPMVTSMGSNRLPKTHYQHRSKRSHDNNNNHTQLIIEDISDKLLSSIDYPIYTQHQRCY
jgi:hypothetical protein